MDGTLLGWPHNPGPEEGKKLSFNRTVQVQPIFRLLFFLVKAENNKKYRLLLLLAVRVLPYCTSLGWSMLK